MPSGTRIDTDTQLKVLAMFARGDTFEQIHAATGLAISTLMGIKKRNANNLALIKDKLIEFEISKSKKILGKAQDLISKKLDKVEESEDVKEQAIADYREGTIDQEEYQRRVTGLLDVTLSELNSVSKEAFNQSQIESGKPTSISSSPNEAKEDLLRLVAALKEGDEETLLKHVFDRDVIEADYESDEHNPTAE